MGERKELRQGLDMLWKGCAALGCSTLMSRDKTLCGFDVLTASSPTDSVKRLALALVRGHVVIEDYGKAVQKRPQVQDTAANRRILVIGECHPTAYVATNEGIYDFIGAELYMGKVPLLIPRQSIINAGPGSIAPLTRAQHRR